MILRLTKIALVLLVALTLPWGVVGLVNETMGTPSPHFQRSKCTRACHNHGCRHAPVLPDQLTGDGGLFGATIRWLKRGAGASGLGGRRGYGALNLLIFSAAWPAAMLGLLALALWQREILREET